MESLKTRDIIWKLAFFMVCSLSFGCCKGQKPRPGEIERVINETHSKIWKCPECAFGQGLNVLCGTSIDVRVKIQCIDCVEGFNYSDSHGYAPCQACKKCAENELMSGQCSKEEDTTKCLGTCFKHFYWEELTASCQPCGDCCGGSFQHEKQCENVGLPITLQCRQKSIRCQHPTPVIHKKKQNSNHRNSQKKTLTILQVVAIVVCPVLIIIVVTVIILFVLWKLYGWQEAKKLLGRCFCCHTVNSSNEVTYHFNNEVFDEGVLESTTLKGSEFYLEEATDRMGPLRSAPPVVKRPGFQRLKSVPVDTCPKVKSVIPRSHSHPGCLGKLGKEQPLENKLAAVTKKCFMEWIRKKKLEKSGYAAVSTEPDPADVAVPGLADAQRQERPRDQSPPTIAQKHQSTSTTGLDHHQASITSVPEHFIKNLLSGKMANIPNKFYCKICIKLDQPRDCFRDDYRMLGEKIGLGKDEVSYLGLIGNPTAEIMQKFDSQRGSSIGKFRDIVETMDRDDVVCVINEWILDEWNNSNYHSSTVVV